METNMNDRYKNGKIYKIVCNVTGKIYIGSTCLPTLAKRLAYHRKGYKQYLEQKYPYVSSFEILENNNYSIILLEEYPCETKDQLLARERYYIDNNVCVNKFIPGRTKKQYYQENREQALKQKKVYYEENKEKIKEYRKNNRDKIAEQRKQYNKKNKEKRKQYYENNKEYYQEYVTCECGKIYQRCGKQRHLRTQKHLAYLETLKNEV